MIRSGPILASLVAAGLVLPTLGSSPASPRITRGPYLQWAPPGCATIVWYRELADDGVVEFRGESGPWVEARQEGVPGRRHQVLLSRLVEGETYEYRVIGSSGLLPDLHSRQEFAFQAPSSSSLRFLAFGDSGSGDANQLALAQLMARESPDLALLLGDIVYPSGLEADYDAKFFAPYAPLLSRVPFYALLGNHDYETRQGAPYLEIFSLPRNGPTHGGEWFEAIAPPASLLRTGINTLALEGHNRSINDPSFILAPELLLLTAQKGSCS